MSARILARLFATCLLPGALLSSALIPTSAHAADASDTAPAGVLKPVSERFGAAGTDAAEPSFQRHIVPVLGRLGCNGRACHGSFQGQGGFRLSLFGYDFKMDHEALLKGESPRINVEVPEDSLLLRKATLNVPHKGGRRMDVGGWEYEMLVRWIEAGAKGAEPNAVRFERLEVQPTQIVFDKPGTTLQLRAIAHWADGTQEDVTPLCRFKTNDESISDVSEAGLVTAHKPGDTHVVVFYDNGVAPVQTILPVTDQIGPRYPQVPVPTKVDALVVEKLRKLGVVPSDLSEDAEFLRRVSLDMTGTLPAPAEIEAFLADKSPDKRSKKVDELLERPAYAAWWATRLCDITGNNPQTFDERNVQNEMARQWYDWMERRLRENLPYDQLVARIFVSKSREPGQDYNQYVEQMSSYFRKEDPADFAARETMPHYWARRTFRTPEDRSLGFAYAFLGVRLQCAQCHKHPYDQWTQDDFNQFKTFFNRIQFAVQPDAQQRFREMQMAMNKDQKKTQGIIESGAPYPWRELFVAAPGNRGNGGKGKPEKNPQKPNQKQRPEVPVSISAKLLGGDNVEFGQNDDPRELLMNWMRDKANPYFARAFVNRVWSAYFGVGIIEPPDDLSLANPPSNGPLLDYLALEFITHNYDIKWLHREIANSRTYQLSWKPNPTNRLDQRNFSHALPRRLPAEVTYDAIVQATSTQDEMAAAAREPGRRAIAQSNATGRANRNSNYALTVFGRPARSTNCDCERSNEPSLLQTIYLQNDQEIANILQRAGWIQQIDRQLNPSKPPETRKLQKGEQQRLAAMANVEQQLKQQRKRAKQNNADAASDKRIATLEGQLKKLQDQQAAAEQAERDAAAPVAAPAPAPVPDRPEQLIREAYLRTLSRPPTEAETARGLQYITDSSGTVAGLRDVLWALLNTKEFIVNH